MEIFLKIDLIKLNQKFVKLKFNPFIAALTLNHLLIPPPH